MRNIVLVCVLALVIQFCCYTQAAPHKSVEEDEDDSGSNSEEPTTARATSDPSSDESTAGSHEPTWHGGHSHEVKQQQQQREHNSSEDAEPREADESDEDDDYYQQPKAGHCPMCPKGPAVIEKAESLCPARPEEITKIEAECAKEFKEWKERRAKKLQQAAESTTETTSEPTTETTTCVTTIETLVETVAEIISSRSEDIQVAAEVPTSEEVTVGSLSEDVQAPTSEQETVNSRSADIQAPTSQPEVTTQEETITAVPEMPKYMSPLHREESTTVTETTTAEDLTAPHLTTNYGAETSTDETSTDEEQTLLADLLEETTLPAADMSTETMTYERRKRSTKNIRKRKVRSCYPATCILRKLNLLDSMSQPSIDRIQSFAVNMSVDDTTNLEEKAVGCLREINEATMDAIGDFGKKVGCIAQKVITCLNKGLTCPIMKVPQ